MKSVREEAGLDTDLTTAPKEEETTSPLVETKNWISLSCGNIEFEKLYFSKTIKSIMDTSTMMKNQDQKKYNDPTTDDNPTTDDDSTTDDYNPTGPTKDDYNPTGPTRDDYNPTGPTKDDDNPTGPTKNVDNPTGPTKDDDNPASEVLKRLSEYSENTLRTILGLGLQDPTLLSTAIVDSAVVYALSWMQPDPAKNIFLFAKDQHVTNYTALLDVLTTCEVGDLLLDGNVTPSEFTSWCDRNRTLFPQKLGRCKALLDWSRTCVPLVSRIPLLAEYIIVHSLGAAQFSKFRNCSSPFEK
jgi:hypothetical protein